MDCSMIMSATVWDVWFLRAYASVPLLKLSTKTDMYLFPSPFSGIGPMMSTTIRSRGAATGTRPSWAWVILGPGFLCLDITTPTPSDDLFFVTRYLTLLSVLFWPRCAPVGLVYKDVKFLLPTSFEATICLTYLTMCSFPGDTICCKGYPFKLRTVQTIGWYSFWFATQILRHFLGALVMFPTMSLF